MLSLRSRKTKYNYAEPTTGIPSLENYSGKFLEATIRAIDGILWIASDLCAPDQLQVGILMHTSIVFNEGLRRHLKLLKGQEDGYAIVTKKEVGQLIASLFPLPGNTDLYSVHVYRCHDQSDLIIERVVKNIYRITISNNSIYCNYTSACKMATFLALAASARVQSQN